MPALNSARAVSHELANTSTLERARTGCLAGALSDDTMAANELVSLPPTSQKPLGDAGVNGFATVAGGDVGHGESYRCIERSAAVAEYEKAAVLLRRQRSCRSTRSAVAANTLTAKRKERGIAPPSVNHEKVVLDAEDSTGAAAAPGRHAAAAATKTAHATPRRAPFPLAAVGQEAPQAMARRMSTGAGKRSGE